MFDLSLLGFCLAFACALVLSLHLTQEAFTGLLGRAPRVRRRRVYRRRPLPRNW